MGYTEIIFENRPWSKCLPT